MSDDNEGRVLAVDRAHVDGAVKGDGQARLEVEAVQGVQQLRVLVVGEVRRGVGQGQVHPPPGVLRGVRDREAVAGERAGCRRGKVKYGVDGRQQRPILQRFDVQIAHKRTSSTSCTPAER